ncbi:AbrB family transcriptional regulator [Hominifimenecus sp. rT4P-3]|uniref:AbrB family transcriptional regulator n=1 Tax=Hominifimenecus sp. rT4P-3 TaxID=3242979 RepID=UPI003DA3AA97
MKFLLTVLIAAIGGFAAKKARLPAPGLVGGMVFVALWNIFTGNGYFPRDLRFYVRVAAGIYVGTGIKIRDVVALKEVKGGVLVALIGMLFSSILAGTLISNVTELDFATAFLATAPGGTQEMTLIAADVGGDPSKVALMQVIRVFFAISFLPTLIRIICEKKAGKQEDGKAALSSSVSKENPKGISVWWNYLLVIAAGLLLGRLFDSLSVPSGSMIGAMVATVLLSAVHIEPYIPRSCIFGIQVFSGAYIGSTIVREQILDLWKIAIPVLIMVLALSLVNVVLGLLMAKVSSVDIQTAMYACAPGGLSDMVIIANDMGADSAKVTALHVLRIMMVVSIYPTAVTVLSRYL